MFLQFKMSGEIDGTRRADDIGQKFLAALDAVEGKVAALVSGGSYGGEVESIFVCPVIVKLSPQREQAGWYKERKLFQRKSKSADFRLRIDYDAFSGGSDEQRANLLLRNIVDAIRILGSRATRDFDGARLERDILGLFGCSYEELQ